MEVKMKDSGIPWIREIPNDWAFYKVKNFVSIKNGKEVPNVSNYDLDEIIIPVYGSGGVFSFSTEVLHIGPSVLLGRKGTIDKPQFIKENLPFWCVDTAFYTIPRENHHIKYFFYCMCSVDYQEYIYGTALPSMTQTILNGINLPVPPIHIQQQIATFLDDKCADIDQLIGLQQKMIDELKAYKQSVITEAVTKGLDKSVPMKDSGIEWIGEVPEGWEIKKIGAIFPIITDFVASGSFASLRENVNYLDEPDYAMLIRTTDLSNSSRSDSPVYISQASYEFLVNSNLFGGEVILPNIGASVGSVYIVPNLYEKMSLAPNSILIKSSVCDHFFYFWFLSHVGKNQLINLCDSTAQQKFNKTNLKELRVVYPPKVIQEEITNFLKNKCTKVDNLISIKQQKIDELKQYKKSMIYEYITGKKLVPN